MLVISKGAPTTVATYTNRTWEGQGLRARGLNPGEWGPFEAVYEQLFKRHPALRAVVNKLGRAQARLPLKVYQRADDGGRPEARDHPLAVLLRNPHPRLTVFQWWEWVSSTEDIYGEAVVAKVRDAGGRPVALAPLHPSRLTTMTGPDGEFYWVFNGSNGRTLLHWSDVLHFHGYSTDGPFCGLSPIESLRGTLENEHYARVATSSMWRRGARPAMALTHPRTLSEDAQKRLRAQFDELYAGAENTGRSLVLEEGMTPTPMTLTAEDAQYIETRKLNREEVCIVYDVPPPVLHILDKATYSNITEQMRSMYRDTMTPRIESRAQVIELQLRDSKRYLGNGRFAAEPDFGGDVYADFLLDVVLEGDPEAKLASLSTAVQVGIMKVNEARAKMNLPSLGPEGDVPLINSALVPLSAAGAARAPIAATPKGAAAQALRPLMGVLGRHAELGPVVFGELERAASDPRSAELVRTAAGIAVNIPEMKSALQQLFANHYGDNDA